MLSRNQGIQMCPPERGKGPASAGRGFPPGSRRIDVYSYKLPARPEAKSALQGRGTGLARWWGHEVLKGPNTLTWVRAQRLEMQQWKL